MDSKTGKILVVTGLSALAIGGIALAVSSSKKAAAGGLSVSFTATTTGALDYTFIPIISGGTAPYTYLWSFGDGGTSTQEQPSHNYAAVGTYSVTLKVTDAAGLTKTVTRSLIVSASSPTPLYGCTDPNATNYDPSANQDDGSCQYAPAPILGCTHPSAINYNPNATRDDGSCIYASVPVMGCTDPNATNYNPNATANDGSCIYPPVGKAKAQIVAISSPASAPALYSVPIAVVLKNIGTGKGILGMGINQNPTDSAVVDVGQTVTLYAPIWMPPNGTIVAGVIAYHVDPDTGGWIQDATQLVQIVAT